MHVDCTIFYIINKYTLTIGIQLLARSTLFMLEKVKTT